MKRRWYISFVLLCVYLFATGGPALVSLTCKCVAMHRATTHVCCHCDGPSDCPTARTAVAAPCCGNHHSTEINLYTGSGADDARMVKCAVIDLPAGLAADCPLDIAVVATADKVAERRAPFVCRGFVRSAGLRAPPALV